MPSYNFLLNHCPNLNIEKGEVVQLFNEFDDSMLNKLTVEEFKRFHIQVNKVRMSSRAEAYEEAIRICQKRAA